MKRNNQVSISVFFPCFNDEKSISKLVETAYLSLPKLTSDFEVIVIDDGSEDKSREVLIGLTQKYNELKLLFHPKNLGYGTTLISGFNAASKDLIFYTDGDGQYDVNELSLLLPLMTKDVDFINGIKMIRIDPTYRIFIGNLYNFIARWLFWLPVYDVDCDFRLIRRALIKKLNLESKSGSICIELVKKAQRKGAKFRQVSIHHLKRSFGESQFFRPNYITLTFKELILLWIDLMIRKK